MSGVGNNTLNFSLDVGNHGAWDWTSTSSVADAATLNSPNLSAAFNAYWVAHGAPSSGTLDVPIRVSMDQPGQVLLTNLQMVLGGSKLRTLRLPANSYSTVTLNYSLSGGSGPAAVAIDVGDNGSIGDTWSGSPSSYPVTLTSDNLGAAMTAYLAGQTGEVDIPIRFYVAPDHTLALNSFSAAYAVTPDVSLAAADIHLPASPPVEGDTIPVSATLHNATAQDSGPLTVAFFATSPDWGDWYIGSALVYNVPAGGTASASISWNTLGFTGSVPVKVVLDPYNRLAETNEKNNEATVNQTILTRPDLSGAISLSDPEPLAGEPVVVTLNETNNGQTTAAASQAGLYNGDPANGGVPIDAQQSVPAISGGASAPVPFHWTPSSPGWYRLYAVSDINNAVNESNKSNNTAWLDVHVGLASPVLIDSGLPSGDPAFTPALSYGYVDPQKDDVLVTCGSGTQPENTLRRDPGGDVLYRFDNLVPAHFYHLDLLLYECDSAGRQETVDVDGAQVAGPEDLGNGLVHRLSILVDPALYQDRSLQVDIHSSSVDGAVVASINLYDIDYRYFDSGGAGDEAFPGSRNAGYVETGSTPSTAWGVLPYQSLRVNQNASTLTYRFAELDPAKVYNLHLTFWQKEGAARLQKVAIDGVDTNLLVNTGDFEIHYATLKVPPAAYQSDGSIDVQISRIGATSGASVNEISLEEQTQASTSGSGVIPTPYFTDVYGGVQIDVNANGQGTPAPAGTVVTALDPRGDVVGSFTVGAAGQYGYMHLYGEDLSADPPIPGMRDGELVTFMINGAIAVAKPSFYWHSDFLVHPVDLFVGTTQGQEILLQPGWNFISFYVEPPSPLLNNVLQSIFNRYDRILSETGVFDTSLGAAFNTLTELHSAQGYYLRLAGTTTANLLTSGLPQAVATPLPLHAGWNWIGYLPRASMPIGQALASISGKFQLVHDLLNTYNPADPLHSTLTSMVPGSGYLVYMNTAATLVYPTGSSSAPSEQVQSSSCGKVAPTPEMMVVYGSVQINQAPAPAGTIVEVVAPRGEVAGCEVIQVPGVLKYMHVFGSDGSGPGFLPGENLVFKLNGKEVDADTPLAWQNNPDVQPVVLNGTGSFFNSFLPVVVK